MVAGGVTPHGGRHRLRAYAPFLLNAIMASIVTS